MWQRFLLGERRSVEALYCMPKYHMSLFGNRRCLYQAEKLLNCSYSSDYLKSLNTPCHCTFNSRLRQHFRSFSQKFMKITTYYVTHILLSFRSIIIFFSPLHKALESDAFKFQSLRLCNDLYKIHSSIIQRDDLEIKNHWQKMPHIRNFSMTLKIDAKPTFKWRKLFHVECF